MIAGVEYQFISEPSTALAALQSGEIAWTDVITSQQVDQLQGDNALEPGVAPSSDYWYLALNEAHAPWDNVKARQAIAYAIDDMKNQRWRTGADAEHNPKTGEHRLAVTKSLSRRP